MRRLDRWVGPGGLAVRPAGWESGHVCVWSGAESPGLGFRRLGRVVPGYGPRANPALVVWPPIRESRGRPPSPADLVRAGSGAGGAPPGLVIERPFPGRGSPRAQFALPARTLRQRPTLAGSG